ncbi:MAG: TetR/AcrR family transcriptional regulator [Gemmatimonadetes bacterium]|nr:TetR/AcrR family transcriptional regulator [Gemmatimonadota bacterium]
MAESRPPRRKGAARAAAPERGTTAPKGTSARAPRAPQQSRGQRRVQEILDAAEAVIAEVGIDAATTNAIAERAGSSVGSLYHFFPSKDAIVQALARRFQALAAEMNARAMPAESITLPPEVLFERIVMNQVALIEQHPAFQSVHDAVCLDPRGLADLEAMRDAIVGQVVGFLHGRYPAMPKRDREPVARLAVSVVQHVLDDARLAPAEQQGAILRELQRMLVRYFTGFDERYGVAAAKGAR